ncbi:alpha/beta hydrolase [Bdellovibrio bacteriovorus]|uniref:Alpha/beta hydrolase n=1 Tax=Bdellovibrio bacteriovorus str. Tiberius TaxID=1069642 RepID=K7YZI4_BDEBC|nr:alpha/beta hydrolase [Bdellovibrio bacteriovorus]AFY02135.1 hypothetical protein Bdt_2452 [Bdellovibrio bacteriovorus str. Tiberius]
MKLTVNFTSQGRMLEGTLFLPEDSSEIFAACLFEGSMTGATAQVTEKLAKEVSAEGFITLIMDHNYFSEDEQAPQPWESPSKRLQDIRAALDFLESHASVDKERIIGVGVSVGAEYLAQVCQEGCSLKGLVVVESAMDDSRNLAVDHLDIPTQVVDETHLDSAVDEIVLWARTLFNGGPSQESAGRQDWSVSDK